MAMMCGCHLRLWLLHHGTCSCRAGGRDEITGNAWSNRVHWIWRSDVVMGMIEGD